MQKLKKNGLIIPILLTINEKDHYKFIKSECYVEQEHDVKYCIFSYMFIILSL